MNKVKNIFQKFNNLLEYNKKQKYDFTIPENTDENMNSNISYADELANAKFKNTPKNVFQKLSDNLDYMKTRYNSVINSDIIIREFTLNARNKQYNAFLVYIDGMVDTELINNFILTPLMMRNRANLFDNVENKVVSEALSNNISVRKVKKFNLVDYIFNNLMPQNSVQKVQKFDEIAMRY